MFCTDCGSQLRDSAKFCNSCGQGVAPDDGQTITGFDAPIDQPEAVPKDAAPARLVESGSITGVLNGKVVHIEIGTEQLILRGADITDVRAFAYAVLREASATSSSDGSVGLTLKGADLSIDISGVEGAHPDDLASEIRGRITAEKSRLAAKYSEPLEKPHGRTTYSTQTAGYSAESSTPSTSTASVAKICITVGIIWLVLSGIGTLVYTFNISDFERAFGTAPSSGERMVRFLLGSASTAFGFAVLIRLNLLAKAQLTRGLDGWGPGWMLQDHPIAIGWGRRLSSGFNIAGGIAIAFGLIVGLMLGSAVGQVENAFGASSSFNAAVFIVVLLASLACALICFAMSASLGGATDFAILALHNAEMGGSDRRSPGSAPPPPASNTPNPMSQFLGEKGPETQHWTR